MMHLPKLLSYILGATLVISSARILPCKAHILQKELFPQFSETLSALIIRVASCCASEVYRISLTTGLKKAYFFFKDHWKYTDYSDKSRLLSASFSSSFGGYYCWLSWPGHQNKVFQKLVVFVLASADGAATYPTWVSSASPLTRFYTISTQPRSSIIFT